MKTHIIYLSLFKRTFQKFRTHKFGEIYTLSLSYGTQTQTTSQETTVATISPDKTMSITIAIDETDILSLEVGQEASVTIDAISSDAFKGTVTKVNTTATSDSGVKSYRHKLWGKQ